MLQRLHNQAEHHDNRCPPGMPIPSFYPRTTLPRPYVHRMTATVATGYADSACPFNAIVFYRHHCHNINCTYRDAATTPGTDARGATIWTYAKRGEWSATQPCLPTNSRPAEPAQLACSPTARSKEQLVPRRGFPWNTNHLPAKTAGTTTVGHTRYISTSRVCSHNSINRPSRNTFVCLLPSFVDPSGSVTVISKCSVNLARGSVNNVKIRSSSEKPYPPLITHLHRRSVYPLLRDRELDGSCGEQNRAAALLLRADQS